MVVCRQSFIRCYPLLSSITSGSPQHRKPILVLQVTVKGLAGSELQGHGTNLKAKDYAINNNRERTEYTV